jgi:hypothetical protein
MQVFGVFSHAISGICDFSSGKRKQVSQMKEQAVSASVGQKKGMDWVTAALDSVSQTWQMPFSGSRWEVDAKEKTFLLVVLGQKDKRKAVKLFSSWELENCLFDEKLQEELKMRLLKLLNFVGTSSSKRKSH